MGKIVKNGLKNISDTDGCDYYCYHDWKSVCGSDHLYYSEKCALHRNSCRVKNPIVYVKYAKSSDDCASTYLYRYLSIFHQ